MKLFVYVIVGECDYEIGRFKDKIVTMGKVLRVVSSLEKAEIIQKAHETAKPKSYDRVTIKKREVQ